MNATKVVFITTNFTWRRCFTFCACLKRLWIPWADYICVYVLCVFVYIWLGCLDVRAKTKWMTKNFASNAWLVSRYIVSFAKDKCHPRLHILKCENSNDQRQMTACLFLPLFFIEIFYFLNRIQFTCAINFQHQFCVCACVVCVAFWTKKGDHNWIFFQLPNLFFFVTNSMKKEKQTITTLE